MRRQRKKSFRRKKVHHRKKSHHKNYNKFLCNFCGQSVNGLPHFCKFCGKNHCSKHLLPEDHNCPGLKHSKYFTLSKKARYSNVKNYNSPKKWKNRRKFRKPRIRLARINKFIKALIFAILTLLLALYFLENNFVLMLEAIAWIYFSIVLYKKAFHWVNRISMADDLSFFGLRVLGVIIVIGGSYLGFGVLLTSILVENYLQVIIPIGCLLVGLILLGAFIAFRTNRRHRVVGIWRA